MVQKSNACLDCLDSNNAFIRRNLGDVVHCGKEGQKLSPKLASIKIIYSIDF